MPSVAVVTAVAYDHAGRSATVDRELEGGLVDVTEVRTPALLTIQTGASTPRYVTFRAIKEADRKPLEVAAVDVAGDRRGAFAGCSCRRDRRGRSCSRATPPRSPGASTSSSGSGWPDGGRACDRGARARAGCATSPAS